MTENYHIIRDTVAPTISMSDVTIKDTEAASYNLMTGVTVADNSGVTPTVTTSGSLSSTPGTYTITYTVRDAAGNVTTSNRNITVEKICKGSACIITFNGITELGQYGLDPANSSSLPSIPTMPRTGVDSWEAPYILFSDGTKRKAMNEGVHYASNGTATYCITFNIEGLGWDRGTGVKTRSYCDGSTDTIKPPVYYINHQSGIYTTFYVLRQSDGTTRPCTGGNCSRTVSTPPDYSN